MIPLSALNQFLFCPRRAALIHIEGIFEDNHHTLRGDIVHEHADSPGYEVAKGITLLRALPVWSDRLALNGKCDIVEVELAHPDSTFDIGNLKFVRPVEFKLGKRRQWENDDAQLCAQALCLEEMFHTTIPYGAIFHADSKRRREVEFTREIRISTEAAVAQLHAMFRSDRVPPAIFKPACEECSLFEVCLPKVTCAESRALRLARAVFET